MKAKKVAIIGAGPAGIAMAIQLKRYGLEPVLFEKNQPGGLLWNANLVENYPGFPGGIPGPRLVELMVNQLNEFGVRVENQEVLELDFNDEAFMIKTRERKYWFRWAAIASGTKPKKISMVEIPDEVGKLVFYEVYPLANVKWKKIAVVGAGDAAFDYALNLARENEVIICNRTSAIPSLPLLVERARDHPNITYHQNIGISRMSLDETGNKINLVCTSPAGMRKITADHLVFAIGREPQRDFVSHTVLECEEELKASGRLYVIGDVKNDIFRQTSISVGDGVLAAMKLFRSYTEVNFTKRDREAS